MKTAKENLIVQNLFYGKVISMKQNGVVFIDCIRNLSNNYQKNFPSCLFAMINNSDLKELESIVGKQIIIEIASLPEKTEDRVYARFIKGL